MPVHILLALDLFCAASTDQQPRQDECTLSCEACLAGVPAPHSHARANPHKNPLHPCVAPQGTGRACLLSRASGPETAQHLLQQGFCLNTCPMLEHREQLAICQKSLKASCCSLRSSVLLSIHQIRLRIQKAASLQREAKALTLVLPS